jgi:hypothetical protein
MPAVAPHRLYPCALCAANTVRAWYTQITGAYLCGICAGALPGDPPQTHALRLDRETRQVFRNLRGEWFSVSLPAGAQ